MEVFGAADKEYEEELKNLSVFSGGNSRSVAGRGARKLVK